MRSPKAAKLLDGPESDQRPGMTSLAFEVAESKRRRMINAMHTGRADAPDGPGLPATQPNAPFQKLKR